MSHKMCTSKTNTTYQSFTNQPPTTEIYTLSLHDALPISRRGDRRRRDPHLADARADRPARRGGGLMAGLPNTGLPSTGLDRKSTRLNSSHPSISYAVFCLKKKKQLNKSAGGK